MILYKPLLVYPMTLSLKKHMKQFITALGSSVVVPSNPSINPDWRDKAAPAGYVKR